MLLSCRILADVTGVNTWRYAPSIQYTQGDAVTVFLQLIDLSQDVAERGFVPEGRRYMPAVGATLSIEVRGTNGDAKKIARAAAQPYPTQDPSIWSFQVLATDLIRGTANLALMLTEGVRITRSFVSGLVRVAPQGA